MRRLTLIRHGLTDWNLQRRFQGQADPPLAEAGRKQARRLGRTLSRYPRVDHVIASPLQRATETAELAFPGHRVVTDPRLMELDFGRFEGRTFEENAADPAWAAWTEDAFLRAPPGGESYTQLRERVVAWFGAIPSNGSDIAAVSHSGTIQMLLSHVLGIERPRWRKRIYLRHSSVTRILLREDGAVVERVNDTRHLDEDGSDPYWDA